MGEKPVAQMFRFATLMLKDSENSMIELHNNMTRGNEFIGC